MALEHAILVSLTERACSGYDLARRFDRSIGQFWTASHQQIYKVLARMEADGWVSATPVPQDGRPDKKVYEVTVAGDAELTGWLAAPTPVERLRSEIAVKVRGAGYGDTAAVAADLRRHRAVHAERLEGYLANEIREFADPSGLTEHRRNQWLVLRAGIALERSLRDWCDEVARILDPAHAAHPEPSPPVPTSATVSPHLGPDHGETVADVGTDRLIPDSEGAP